MFVSEIESVSGVCSLTIIVVESSTTFPGGRSLDVSFEFAQAVMQNPAIMINVIGVLFIVFVFLVYV